MIVSYDTIMQKNSPYTITNQSLNLALKISTLLGKLEGIKSDIPQPALRKQNRIKTIQGSLAIEGNTLSTKQITALLDNKKVLGPKKDIIEVINAIETYARISDFQFTNFRSLLKAHYQLMKGSITDAGQYRKGNVGIFKGSKVSHVAPKHTRVPELMGKLFDYLKKEKDTHTLIKSCIFHYELLFIHPFSDGNGRIARLWQSVILMKFHPIFEYLPVESLIKEKQQQYYDVLEKCDQQGDSTSFIEFSLDLILSALTQLSNEMIVETQSPITRLMHAKKHLGSKPFTRKDYRNIHKTIATATASRDLKHGVDNHILIKSGEKALAVYEFQK